MFKLRPEGEPSGAVAKPVLTTSNSKDKADHEFRIRHRLRGIENEIDGLETKNRLLNMSMDKELTTLRNSKTSSNNNLAGATRDSAISAEMSSVAGTYANKIKTYEIQIETLRQERTRLQEN